MTEIALHQYEHSAIADPYVDDGIVNSQLPADQRGRQSWSFWCGVGFFGLVVLAMLTLVWYLAQRISAAESAPVTALVIDGELPYTQKADIIAVVEKVALGNFFNVNVNEVQREVAKLPWVYSVSVRKQWPNELKIYVVDQTPIALWNGDFLINKFGNAFQASSIKLLQPLPQFFGPEGSEAVALENYNNINDLLSFSSLAIAELVLSERFSWQLTLSDGITLNLGRENRVERIQRFIDIYPQIKENRDKNQEVDYIDLRYDTGLAVGWKPAVAQQRA